MDEQLVQEMRKAAERFYGLEVRIVIDDDLEPKPRPRKVKPPNNHFSKSAPMGAGESEEEQVS
jgi:hypothetical protein